MPLNTKIPQQIVSSTTTALSVKRGDAAMLVADLDKGAVVLMDGKTYGGIPMAREDVQIRAGSDAITINSKKWAPLLGNVNIDIDPSGFIENVVSPTDKVLGVGVDGKIAAQLSVAYDENTGLFSLKGKDGETISSFTLVIPTGITPKSVALVENPEGQEPGLYLEFVFIDDDDVEIKLYADMDVLKDVYTAGRGITISDDRVISVDEDAISGVIADDLIEENSGLKVVNDKLHLADHASETPEYGLGDEDNYGHVRLADAGDSRATVQAGIAATPAAVKDVDDRAVHKEGDETISGVKTFVDTPQVTLSDGSVTEVATVDGTVWNKRVEELPEDTDALTENMPVGALLVMPSDGPADIFQVVDQDGQKALVEVPVGSDDIWGRYVPGVVPDNPAALIADLPVGAYVTDDKQLPARSVPAPYNTEEWITESGTWTAPVTGWYELLLFGGGASGYASTSGKHIDSMSSGAMKSALLHLEAGQEVAVTVGAGGASPGDNAPANYGGTTSFAEVSTAGEFGLYGAMSPGGMSTAIAHYYAYGAGIGGGYPSPPSAGMTQAERNAACNATGHYGGSGAAVLDNNNLYGAGAGAQGSVRVRYYDPSKENN